MTLRLIEESERERFDEELATKHYLKNATAVGRVLRYVAEYRGHFNSATGAPTSKRRFGLRQASNGGSDKRRSSGRGYFRLDFLALFASMGP